MRMEGNMDREYRIQIFKIIACYLSHFQSKSQVRRRFMEPETGLFPVRAEGMDCISKEALPQLLKRGDISESKIILPKHILHQTVLSNVVKSWRWA